LDKGMTVVMYPEGTITADPLHWPMTGRTGAARLALETGVPVIPVGQWGPQEVMGYKEMTFPKLWPRKTMKLYCGTEVELSDLHGHHDRASVREATNRIMDAIDAQVARARGEFPPSDRYDMRKGRRVPKSVAPARPVVDPR
ncbi:MAG: 1-acyl-sn-glycerol-3-phosphate acyltransferase, partial [Cutibacterium avidum]|nr:1-acyl-sn-glycerol-3-phosphate acyltransferase [Cutibacterium avidum]